MSPWWLQASDDELRETANTTPAAGEATAAAKEATTDADATEPSVATDEALADHEPAANDDPPRLSGDREEQPALDSAVAASRGDRRKRKRKRKKKRQASPGPAATKSAGDDSAPETTIGSQPPPDEPVDDPRRSSPVSPPAGFFAPPGGFVYPTPERQPLVDERKIAMFCDLENIALGVRASEIKTFDVNLVLERLLEKGKIIAKKAYADWERYSSYKRPFHGAAIELIDIPQKYYSGKNSADIKMVVDAMDLCYSKEHLDTFAIVSGDSDFSPLVSKLKENNKYVIGIGVKNSSSSLLIDNCDEFIYYEDVWRIAHHGPRLGNLAPKQAEAFGLMSDAILALVRENKEVLWGSMIKQTMQRKKPSFNESYYGYDSFSELLQDAQRQGIIDLERDERSGSYVVNGFAQQRA